MLAREVLFESLDIGPVIRTQDSVVTSGTTTSCTYLSSMTYLTITDKVLARSSNQTPSDGRVSSGHIVCGNEIRQGRKEQALPRARSLWG